MTAQAPTSTPRPAHESRAPALGTLAPRPTRHRATEPLTRLLAAGLVVLSAMRFEVWNGLMAGTLVAFALAPLWVRHLRRFAGARLLTALVVACIASGAWLTALAAADHTIIDRHVVGWSALMLGLLTTVGAVLWARTLLRDSTVALLYGVGMLAGLSPGQLSGPNPWKFALSMPVTVLVLALAWRSGRRWLEVVVALAVAAVSALNDSRSHFAMLLLVVVLLVWQSWFRVGGRRASGWRAVVVLAGLAYAVYLLGQAMLLDGYLGLETQLRSQQQVAASGSVILGGRPEVGATTALMAHRPLGLGTGTSPTAEEVLVAKGGMMRLGYEPNNGYVENYMFGELVELHSVIGDTWALFGIPGLALAAFLAWAVLRRAGTGLVTRGLTALLGVLVVRTCWDLFFGPLYSDLSVVALTLGLVLLPRTAADGGARASRSRPARHRDQRAVDEDVPRHGGDRLRRR